MRSCRTQCARTPAWASNMSHVLAQKGRQRISSAGVELTVSQSVSSQGTLTRPADGKCSKGVTGQPAPARITSAFRRHVDRSQDKNKPGPFYPMIGLFLSRDRSFFIRDRSFFIPRSVLFIRDQSFLSCDRSFLILRSVLSIPCTVVYPRGCSTNSKVVLPTLAVALPL